MNENKCCGTKQLIICCPTKRNVTRNRFTLLLCRERAQIDQLKAKITQLEDELKSKELKYRLSYERLKNRADGLTKHNDELNQEVHALENERLKLLTQGNKGVQLFPKLAHI